MEQAPVQIGQFILGKNLGIGAFGKVSFSLKSWRHFTVIQLVDIRQYLTLRDSKRYFSRFRRHTHINSQSSYTSHRLH
jgi:hypothetical protein